MDLLCVVAARPITMGLENCTEGLGQPYSTWTGHVRGRMEEAVGGYNFCWRVNFCGLALTLEPALAAVLARGFIASLGSNRKCIPRGAPQTGNIPHFPLTQTSSIIQVAQAFDGKTFPRYSEHVPTVVFFVRVCQSAGMFFLERKIIFPYRSRPEIVRSDVLVDWQHGLALDYDWSMRSFTQHGGSEI